MHGTLIISILFPFYFRSLSPTAGQQNTSLLRSSSSQLSPYDTHSLSRRHLKSRVGVIDDDSSKVIMKSPK